MQYMIYRWWGVSNMCVICIVCFNQELGASTEEDVSTTEKQTSQASKSSQGMYNAYYT